MKKKVSILLVLAMYLSLCACGGSKYEKYDTLISYIENKDSEKALAEVMRLMHEDDEKEAGKDAEGELTGEEAAIAMLCKEWELTDYQGNATERAMFNADGTCKIGDKSGVYTPQYYEYDNGSVELSVSIMFGEDEWHATLNPYCKIDSDLLYVSDKDWNNVGRVYKSIYMATEKEQYEYIVEKLGTYNQFKENSNWESPSNDNLSKYYEVLTALGDYEDAKTILARFTVLDNVALKEVRNSTDSFGQVSSYDNKVFMYDKYGNQLENYNLLEIKYDGERIVEVLKGYSDKIDSKYVCEYDANGNLVKESKINSSGSGENTTYTYNEAGQIATETKSWIYSDGSVNENRPLVYVYNEAGLKAAKSTTEEGWNTKYTYVYDSQNRLVEEIQWESNYEDKYEEEYKYTYNYLDNGDMNSYTYYRFSNEAWQEEYTIEYVYGTYYVYSAN